MNRRIIGIVQIAIILLCMMQQFNVVIAKIDYAQNVIGNPSSLDSPLQDIQWCGDSSDNDQKVVILTAKGSVYRSDDRGASWQKMVDAFTRAGINAKMDLNQNVGSVNQMIASPVDSSEIVFMGTDGINWITTDCGVTIQTLGINLNLKEFMYHPTEQNWMLASSWNQCDAKNTKDKRKSDKDCVITKDLYYSENKGKSWKVLLKYVVQFAWAHKLNSKLSEVPSQRIIFSKEIGNTGHQRIKGWNMKTHLYYSDDFMKTSNMIVNQGNKFLLTETYLFAAQVNNSESQLVQLMVSNANVKEYSFKYAQVPLEIHQHSFTILDTKEGQVFLNINNLGNQSPMGTIYNSDSTGTRFSVSLEDNVRGSDGQCDFESVNGVEGIFIANVYSHTKNVKDVKQRLGAKNPDTSDNDIPTEKNRKKGNQKTQGTEATLKEALQSIQQNIVSRITFDKGSIWQPIRAPIKDSAGKPTNCELSKKCSLHLHSVSSQLSYGPAYSSENSVGLIIATGNVGQFLNHKAGKVNTFLSRDGGLVWEEIRKGSHIYEVADHGSIIVMANDQQPTKDILFSWDEGRTWNTKQISDIPIMVSNIITEPGNTSDKFLVYGTVDIEGDTDISGLIVLLDFSSLHPRDCQGHDSPESPDSDYEYWIPHNPNEFCLLGRETKYVRRKRDAACFNPENFERPVSVRRCECTEQDWDCDLGFKRSGKDRKGECVPEEGYQKDYNPPEVCNSYYEVTQGYRKVAGNLCEGGVNRAPIKVPCPMFGFLSINSLFYNIFVLAAMFALFYFILQNKEVILAFLATRNLDQHAITALAFVMNTFNYLKATLIPSSSNTQLGYFQAQQSDEEKGGYSSMSSKGQVNQFHDDLIEDHDDEDHDAVQQKNTYKHQINSNSNAPAKQDSTPKPANNTNNTNQSTSQHNDLLLDEEYNHEEDNDPFDPRS